MINFQTSDSLSLNYHHMAEESSPTRTTNYVENAALETTNGKKTTT
jgi:hypothetical protein